MSGTHSLFSPSGAHRWSRCIGSLAASKGMPNETSVYAAEGTVYHDVSALALDLGWQCEQWVGKQFEEDGFKFTIDQENADFAQVYVDAIRRLPGELKIEVELDTSPIYKIDDQSGTGDAVLLDRENKTIRVHDLKFGMGEVVYAHSEAAAKLGGQEWMGANEQLMIYGAAALYQFNKDGDWQFVEIGIHQPRIGHYDSHVYSRAQVLEFVKYIRERALMARGVYDSDDRAITAANLTPGEKQCRWCPIRGNCAARAQGVLNEFPVTESAIAAYLLTDEALGEARSRVEEIEQWCKDIKVQALQRAINGATIPGWDLSTGRKGHRKFTDEMLVEARLSVLGGAAYEEPSLISPAVAEKKLKKHPEVWEALQDYISQSDGAQTLVRAGGPLRVSESSDRVEFGLVEEFV